MTRDLRDYARQTTIQLGIGFIFLLFVVGIGLIYLIYGKNAALIGLVCLFVGVIPLLLIALALWFIGEIVKKNREG